MKKPKKKKITNALNAQQSFECIGYNRACNDWEAFLTSEDEIEKIITETQANILLKHGVPATNRDLAKAIYKAIGGEE